MNTKFPPHRLILFAISLVFLMGCSKSFQALLDESRKAFDETNYAEATDSLNLALTRWSKEDGAEKKSEAYYWLGKTYEKTRNVDKAIEAYNAAIKSSDQAYDSAYALGNIYLATNESQMAAKAFQVALGMKKNDPLALLGWGNSLYAQKKFDEAKTLYQQLLDTSPGVKDAMENLSILQVKNKPVKVKTRVVKTQTRAPAKKTTVRRAKKKVKR